MKEPVNETVKLITERGKERRAKKAQLSELIDMIEKELKGLPQHVLDKDKQARKVVAYLDDLKTDLMAVDLYSYIKGMWHVAQTGSIFKEQWYIKAICEHLEWQLDLEFLKMIVSISPRSAKSTIISQLTPTWLWINDQTEAFISASYSDDLVKRDMTISRNIIESEEYQRRWGNLYKLSKDQNEKKYYTNTKGGFRIAITPQGKGTGFGATWLLVDDPHKAQEAENPNALRKVKEEWWDGAMTTRHRIPETFRRVIIHQRLSDEDLAGRLQNEDDNWIVLSLQEEYTGMKIIGWNYTDPRTSLGELLKPDLFGRDAAEEKKRNPHVWQAQFQQEPMLRGSSYVKMEHLSFWSWNDRPALTDFRSILTSWDLSSGSIDDNASYTCGIVCGLLGNKKYIIDWVYGRMTFVEQLDVFKAIADKYSHASVHLVENVNGLQFIDYADKKLDIRNIVPINPKDYGGSKEARFFSCLPEFVNRRVIMPSFECNPLSKMFEKHLLGFPKLREKDFCDAISQLLNYLFYNDVTDSKASSYTVIPERNPHEDCVLTGHELFDVQSCGQVRDLFV